MGKFDARTAKSAQNPDPEVAVTKGLDAEAVEAHLPSAALPQASRGTNSEPAQVGFFFYKLCGH